MADDAPEFRSPNPPPFGRQRETEGGIFFLRIALLPLLLFNAFVWGVSWWPFRQLNSLGLHALWATGCAFGCAALLISLWRPSTWRDVLASPGLCWLMVASGMANIGFNWGMLVGEVVRVVLLFYLMPVWAAPLARWLLGEPITALTVARIVMAVSGAAIVLYEPGLGMPVPSSLADWLGLVGGIAFAGVNVLLRYNTAERDSARVLAMFAGAGLLATLLAATMTAAGVIAPPPPPAPLWIAGAIGLAIVALAANLSLQYAAARLPASVTVLVMLSEVVFAAVSASWFAGEALVTRTLIGGAMIVLAAALAALVPPAATAPAGRQASA